MKIWTEVPLTETARQRLRALGEVIEGAAAADLPGCDVAIIGASVVDAGFIEKAGPSLKLAIRTGIGYEKVDVAACSAAGVLTANTPDGPTESTAEQTVMLLLAVARKLELAGRRVRAGLWGSLPLTRGWELRGMTLGVVGFGRIGRRVTEICTRGIGMHALVFDPFVKIDAALYPDVRVADALETVLREADFVTLHAPLLPQTRHMIGERELRMMKPGAHLVNASRGGVIDEAALIRVLEDGHLGGVGLDVFEAEPTPADNPLLKHDLVVALPHTAGNTHQGAERMLRDAIDQIGQLSRGEKLTHLLDPGAWPGRAGKV